MANSNPKPATLHDVARLANVSYQTVSRVINDTPTVAASTRERVLKAIRELDYMPNRAARTLITGRSNTLQLISFNIDFTDPLHYLILEARDSGYHLGVSTLRDPKDMDELKYHVNDLNSRLVDGYLLFGPEFELDYESLNVIFRSTPFVQIGANPCPMIPAVLFDQRYAIQQVMKHLLDLGHNQIAELHGPLSIYDARARHETYLESMKTAGLPAGPIFPTDFTPQGGYDAAQRLLETRKSFTAIVCGNDSVALGVLRAVHEKGIRVPQDVSVVGFDDSRDVTFYEPPLTTIRQDYTAQSRQAIQYLISLIETPETPRYQQVIYPQLILRESTGSAQGSDTNTQQ
jgi:LacI family transcriptional regulator